MTIDKIKVFLKQALSLRREIVGQQERLAMLKSAMTSPRGTMWSTLKTFTGVGSDPLGDAVVKKIGLEVAIEQDIAKLSAVVLAIEQAVEGLEDSAEREVLRLRYLNGLSWERVAKRMGYSKDRVFQIHRQAIIRLQYITV